MVIKQSVSTLVLDDILQIPDARMRLFIGAAAASVEGSLTKQRVLNIGDLPDECVFSCKHLLGTKVGCFAAVLFLQLDVVVDELREFYRVLLAASGRSLALGRRLRPGLSRIWRSGTGTSWRSCGRIAPSLGKLSDGS